MRKLAVLLFQSLDGVMQAPSSPDEDNSNQFDKGGWAEPYWEEVMGQVMHEAMIEPYDMLLGRKTYEIFASHFPNADANNRVAKKLNAAKKYVVSTTLHRSLWGHTEYLNGVVADEVEALKNEKGPLLQVHGSWELVQELLKHNLIDEFRIWTFPVTIGQGKRLFGDGTKHNTLTLIKSKQCENGTLMHFYTQKKT